MEVVVLTMLAVESWDHSRAGENNA
jgi:hypothetical protein